MKKLGYFILDLKEYITLAVLIVISLILIFLNDNPQIRFLRAAALTSFGTVESGISAIPNVFDMERENKQLRENNIKLANEIASLKESKLENIRLTRLLNFKDKNTLGVVSGKIINKSLLQTRNTITLNVGESDSVAINMPVITDAGLVGRIVATSRNYSIAQILYNKDMRITVKVQRNRLDGILSYDGVSSVTVANIQKSADVNVGDVIITSEYSNIYPAGIPIGTVTETGNLDNLFKKVVVTPLVDFSVLEEVFILKFVSSRERVELEKVFQKK
ncbi:MAG: rod shape-determining protein MreC [Ignavibacteriae bacterium]|nr:rod shape-determining protein MreC [Ignavibacteriota bacterium]